MNSNGSAPMPGIDSLNLKVALLDSDFYSLQAINSYLAWDRRTRVTFMTTELDELRAYLYRTPAAELPDVIVMDADHLGSAAVLGDALEGLQEQVPDVKIICLAQSVDPSLIDAAAGAGAAAYLLKQEVKLQITWAIVYALERDFVVTAGVARGTRRSSLARVYRAHTLPEQREYPEMTERIRQAIKLCVIEGMPAHLAADEMGISLHTIRGYIKEGYRILEAYDNREYPTDMTPQERAFMRFTALANDE